MTPLPSAGSGASASGFWLRLQRERALIALFNLGRQRAAGLRLARIYAWGAFVGYGFAICLTRGSARSAAIHGLVRAALVSLSWVVGGLAALGSARALAQQTEGEALTALAVQRGFPRSAFARARTWAAAALVARVVGGPALLLVGVGLANGSSLSWALAVAPAIAIYAVALGLSLALLAHFSAELAPRHPGALLSALLLGPLLLSWAFPGVPSVPSLFSGLLSQLLAAGAALT
ncbi:MAG TPA: hypothetical protein VFK05_31090 [Polyangiaceae bacterium]|nr:hypothetical protein [Polyangiaceae bacterium]